MRTLSLSLVVVFLGFISCAVKLSPCRGAEPVESTKGTLDPATNLVWYDLRLLDVEGRGWTDTLSFYDRLPAKAEAIVRPDVWRLSRQASGICARFVTNATTLRVQWTLGLGLLQEWNMPAVPISGLDLYVKHEGAWRWLAVGKPERQNNDAVLFKDIPAGEREFLLYLPLYNIVSSISLGLPRGMHLAKAEPYSPNTKPIVFYGTSITQGGCVSRSGMVYTANLGRRLNRPVINLGFRANGTMDLEMAALIAELDPCVYVLDCLANMNSPEITERVEPFVAVLRKARPETPILLPEDRTYPDAILNVARRERNEKSRIALREAYDRLTKAGFPGLYYLSGSQLIGDDGEATVDASHPTDLGHTRMADLFEDALRPLLTGR